MEKWLQEIYAYAYAYAYAYTYAKTLLALKGGEGSGNFGHAGRPGLVGGSASRSHMPNNTGKIVSENMWTAEKGGYLYHGTRMPDDFEYIHPDKDGVVYMTNDFDEAVGYAEGAALSADYGGTPRVVAAQVNSGKSIDVQAQIDDALENGVDFSDIFAEARNQGADFVYYYHPSNVGADDQFVVVVLNPGSTMGNVVSLGYDVVRKRNFIRPR